ncbi:MAG: radical SAM protein [Lachnospiraceae bacterium]|nr:radical SAM protein [Lachnospiraceae bacterium]
MTIHDLVGLKEITKGKKVVVFGTGSGAQKLWHWLDILDITDQIAFCLDNNKERWGFYFLNKYEIKGPEVLNTMDESDICVLIASQYYEEIKSQLEGQGDYLIYNAHSCCDDEWKDLWNCYKNRNIIIIGDSNVNEVKAFAEIIKKMPASKNFAIQVIPEEEIDKFSPEENQVFWITGKNHLDIENQLIERDFRANIDFVPITHFIYPDYIYLKTENKKHVYEKLEFGEKSMKEYFCWRPFMHMDLYLNTADLCCPWYINHLSVGNIQEKEGIDELWNSPMSRLVRESILNGSYYFCNSERCPVIKTGSLLKKEEITDPFYRKIIDENTLEIEGGPAELNIAFDDQCNLRCRMCRETNVRPSQETKDKMWDILRKLKEYEFTNLKRLTINGSGEVFYSPVCLEILNHLEEFIMPNLEEILIQSNGILLGRNEELIKKLSRKYRILVTISIDAACTETYSIIRRGGSYKQLLDSLAVLASLREKGVVYDTRFNYCIQRINVRELVPFVEFAKKYKADTVWFQKIMGYSISEKVDDERNVYHEVYVEQLNRAIQLGKKIGVNVGEIAIID